MTEVGIALLVVAALLVIVAVVMSRRRSAQTQSMSRAGAAGGDSVDFAAPRPRIAAFHVQGDAAMVTFDVPLPEGDVDAVLADLLVDEAVEVVREKRHSLPIDQVTKVVALAGSDDAPREVGRLGLVTPGELPPPVVGRSPLHFGAIGFDPIDQEFAAGEPEPIPAVADRARGDDLAPLTDEVRLPKAVDVGLRAQGIDPETMSAGELVRGTLSLFGYQIAPGIDDVVSFASKAGQRTLVKEDRYEPGGYPEVEEEKLRTFMLEFAASGADRGVFVSDRYGPFGVHQLERREPRVRFITRERLQKFVDAMAVE